MANWLPKRLSVTAVDAYAQCPAAYQRRYVHGVMDPPTPAMAFGRCMATALEALHRGRDGDVSWVREYARLQAAGALQGAPTIQHGLGLLAAYQAFGVGVGEPEWRFELPFPNPDAVPVPLIGFLDLATATEILEFKTSAATWDQGRADNSSQAAVYAWAYTRLMHRKPERVRFLILHTRRVELTVLDTYPAIGEMQLFELRAAATWRGIRDGHFPAICGRSWCAACDEAGVANAPSSRGGGLELTW